MLTAEERKTLDDFARPYLEHQGRSLLEEFETFCSMAPVTLYDQFGRPVYVPSSAPKIGDTITVKRPVWV